MIVTESVHQLINELCTSLQKTEGFQPQTTKQTKTLKSRLHEILLKSVDDDGSRMDPHELYLHELELKISGEGGGKCLAMEKCCRLVERDEYFQTEIGQSVMAFLLKLRNTGSKQVCDL